MDLMTAIALAPSQPPRTVVKFVLGASPYDAASGTWFCRLDCFQRFGLATWGEGDLIDIAFVPFDLVDMVAGSCMCNGPRLHQLYERHPD